MCVSCRSNRKIESSSSQHLWADEVKKGLHWLGTIQPIKIKCLTFRACDKMAWRWVAGGGVLEFKMVVATAITTANGTHGHAVAISAKGKTVMNGVKGDTRGTSHKCFDDDINKNTTKLNWSSTKAGAATGMWMKHAKMTKREKERSFVVTNQRHYTL